MSRPNEHDFDWLVIGSGFGGSVCALRLSEKGHRVGVLEAGRRYADHEYAKTPWNLKRFLWLPQLGLRGILRLTVFKDVFILSGSAVGGGSTVYANTLYQPAAQFFKHPQWAHLHDWEAQLAPHYATATRMLGVTQVPFDNTAQRLLRDLARHFSVEHTFCRTPCAVYFGAAGVTVPDPYFNGAGPDRTGCIKCGACMIGCRTGAKNTLLKNYLWFAEKLGATVVPDCEVVDIAPFGNDEAGEGYRVTTERPGAWWRKRRQVFTARGVVVAAGALGTNRLLALCKQRGSLPHLSNQLGQLARTNSESLLAITKLDAAHQPGEGVAISASIYPRPDTHLEFVTYGPKGDMAGLFFTLLTGAGTRWTRPLRWVGTMLRHPVDALRTLSPFGWGKRSLVLLAMQSLDNAIRFRLRRGLLGGWRLTTDQHASKPNPTYIPLANEAAAVVARQTGGIAQSMFLEATANIPTTAHLLGGAVIAGNAHAGVVDRSLRAFGYQNLLVCDGSVLPANPGVNPSLTIAALAEHAMSQVLPARHRSGMEKIELL
jgi:cholesterol oxidase